MISASAREVVGRFFKYFAKATHLLREFWSFDAHEKSLRDYFTGLRAESKAAGPVLLVQCVEDLYYYGLFGRIASSLREHNSLRVEQFVLRSVTLGESASAWRFVKLRLFVSPLQGHKWVLLYNSFCDGIAYRSTSFRPLSDLVDLVRSWNQWRTLCDRSALLKLTVSGIFVGDLVNDTYLRFKPAPTLSIRDFYLWVLIWQAHRDVRRALVYFSRARPKIYLTSYSTYTQHGIAARVALRFGVRVFSFGNFQEFSKELTLEDWHHTRNPDGYADRFARFADAGPRLVQAEAALLARISGIVDGPTAYMRKSAYAESGEPVPDVSGAVVIFLHDFYDSPHVYRDVVFPDFWEWACFSIETLRAANIPFFLKPHPNQVLLNDRVLQDLGARYAGLPILSPRITNKQLADAGMACAVTVYGTVAHEMAFLGVPTITSARHPHVSFDFCITATNREQYAEALKNHAKIPFDKEAMRRQSLRFYYIHNLDMSDEEISLMTVVSGYRAACSNSDKENPQAVAFMTTFVRLPAYQKHISGWSATLQGSAVRMAEG